MTLTLTEWEAAAKHFEPRTHRWPTPGQLAAQLEHRTIQTPALDLVDAELTRIAEEPGDHRVIISMAPQEGKSTRVAGIFPTWWLTEHPDDRVAIASYGQSLATRNGRSIRRRITEHPELGLQIAPDNGAAHEWELLGHDGGVLSVGIGGGFTGKPVDLLIIDDPIKDRKEADSETYRNAVWDWWTDVASARFGATVRVVLILTRWHEDDLAGRLLAAEDADQWRVLNIPAQADHDPAKGETDPLEREPGEFMISARGRSRRQWESRKITAGSRTWAALYQGRPSPAEGDTFKRTWWKQYDQPLHIERPDTTCIVTGYDELIMSWDLTFKDTKASDFVVGQVWMRRGVNAYLLDQVRDRMDFVRTCAEFKRMALKWPQATLKIVEDKANGPAVIAALSSTVAGIVPEEPQGSKEARASAVTPLVEAGNVWIPDPAIAGYAWVSDFIEEAAGFPTGTHDDQVDALTQALNRLILQPFFMGQDVFTADELDDEVANYTISPY